MLLWYAARLQPQSDGSAATQLTDFSGNNNHATQATGSKQALFKINQLNGQPSFLFDSTSSQFYNLTTLLSIQSFTAFVVFKQTVAANNNFFNGNSGAPGYRVNNTTRGNLVKANTANIISSNAAFVLNTFYQQNATYTNPTGIMRSSRAADDSATSAQTFTDPIRYIGALTGSSEFYNGYLAELMLYSPALSLATIQKLEKLLFGIYNV